MRSFLLLFVLVAAVSGQLAKNAVRGIHCSKNQAVNKVTVYEDGAIEAECGPIPCGMTGDRCLEDVGTNCRAETDLYSGMRWAKNGQSLLLRCCTYQFPQKTYIGTDLVPLGSFYTGGLVARKDMYANAGPEFDYVANVRMEQGGLRVWVYRILCPNQTESHQTEPAAVPARFPEEDKTQAMEAHRQFLLKQIAEQQSPVEVAPSVDEEPEAVQAPVNPLQYRPPAAMRARQRDSPLRADQRVL
ncbi:hypothetical protein M3Y99_00730900 [Aphelenchoides fujianensis]|nr:hypothetical protein M3Y99_00730900 [Aphelenchoides fujianensis]